MDDSSTEPELNPEAVALDIDVRCALAFGRAALRALTAVSREAHSALDRCLAEELPSTELHVDHGSAAVRTILEELRLELRAQRDEADRKRGA